jgi:hypothetical protein
MKLTPLTLMITLAVNAVSTLASAEDHPDLTERDRGRLATHLMNCGYFDEYLDLEQRHNGSSDYERGKSEAIRQAIKTTPDHCQTSQELYKRLR